MKKILPIVLILGLMACKDEDVNEPVPTEFGFLKMGISLDIDELPANGRVAAVNTDAFLVNIYDNTDVLVESFDPFSTAPAEIQLPTGEYYITASSNDLVEAAFDSPYYFGRSDNFTIDKEELKSVDVTAYLANSKVAINYSANVVNTFTSYTGQVTVNSSATTLAYSQGETRAGYFVSGGDLFVEVFLSYTKLDGSTIDRTFSTTISGALAKTQYNVNVDATLADGEISINLIVDEGVDEVDIDLGNSTNTNSLFLDGTANVSISHDPLLSFNDSFTLEAWVKSSQSAPLAKIIFKEILPANQNYFLAINNGKAHVRFDDASDGRQTESTTNVNDNQWHHIAGVYDRDNTQLKIYVDGVLENSLTIGTQPLSGGSSPVLIGGGNGYFLGLIDEVRIWNDARSTSEIQAYMNQELIGNEAKLAAYYKLNDGTGSSIALDEVQSLDGSLAGIDVNTDWGTDTPF